MISSFTNFTQLTQNTTILPITPEEVRAISQYFDGKRDSTDIDAEVSQYILEAVFNWENETRFLLLDQTFKVFLYNEYYITQNFIARLPVSNVHSVDNIKYHPSDWNYTDAKITLDPTLYFITPEVGTDTMKFQLRSDCLEVFKMYNNLEFNGKGGYENNNFTNMPLEIKRALILMTADILDARKGYCACQGAFYNEVLSRYKKRTAYNISITI